MSGGSVNCSTAAAKNSLTAASSTTSMWSAGSTDLFSNREISHGGSANCNTAAAKNSLTAASSTTSMWSAGSTDLFSNREISLLIELVEALPVLYAADKKVYKGVLPREKAWKIIAEKLNRTVTECEKKWRYLRDKYVKERRRLLDETKSTGRDTKSNWQHYESMEFLSIHLRLPMNGSDRSYSLHTEDEDNQMCSEGSPLGGMLSPPSNIPDLAAVKSEMDSRLQNVNNWLPTDADKSTSQEQNGGTFKPLAPPPHYPGFLNRPAAPGTFPHHPLWAMWSNSIAQAQAHHHLQQLNSLTPNPRPPVSSASNPSPPASDIAVCNDDTQSDTGHKRLRRSLSQDLNINVSIKDLAVPAEKLSEYHFCVSLAQMMENIPSHQRPELKIKLMQVVTSSYPQKVSQCDGSPTLSL